MRPGGITHCAGFASSVQTNAASQFTKRASRAGRTPCAPRHRIGAARPRGTALTRDTAAHHCWNARTCATNKHPVWQRPPADTSLARGLGCAAGGAYAQPRSAGQPARARSALRELTRGACLNGAGAARAVSCVAGPADRAPQGTLRAAKGCASKPPAAQPKPLARQPRRHSESPWLANQAGTSPIGPPTRQPGTISAGPGRSHRPDRPRCLPPWPGLPRWPRPPHAPRRSAAAGARAS